MKNSKQEFSKVLAIAVTILFFVSIIFVFAVWFFQDRLGTEILAYVAAPFGVVITGYFAKAGVENYTKIKGQEPTDEVVINREYENYKA